MHLTDSGARTAIRRLVPRSAWHLGRFVYYKSLLAAATVLDVRHRRNAQFAPLPPARLRQRVSGSTDPRTFLAVGRRVAADLDALLRPLGRSVHSFESVLDFGCGPARVLRFLRDAPPSCRLHGTDIDPRAIEWCRKNHPEIAWSVNDSLPPLPFPDASFDLVFAVSVFTHLDETLEQRWLAELRRVTRPGAILILSVHGERLVQAPVSAHLFVTGPTGWLKPDGLPDFYQNSFHTGDYIRDTWSTHFDVLEYRERAINDHQDAVVLRRP